MWAKRLAAVITAGLMCMAVVAAAERGEDDGVEFVSGNNTYEKTVAITFDDGPGRNTTPELLDGLKERNVEAAFFVVGENIEGNEDIIRRMHDEGHIIGNHTFTHVELDKLSENAALTEVSKTNAAIEKITGEKVKYIRPPCGSWNEELYYKIDMTPVFWSVDPKDWCTDNVSVSVSRVMEQTQDGDIILFHDIYDTSVAAALEVIDRLQTRGYRFVTLDDLLIE